MEAATTAPHPLQALASQLFGDALAVKVQRAAEALSCSPSQVYYLLDSGQLEAVRLGDRKKAGKRVSVLSLLSFIASGGVERGSGPSAAERLAASKAKRGPSKAFL